MSAQGAGEIRIGAGMSRAAGRQRVLVIAGAVVAMLALATSLFGAARAEALPSSLTATPDQAVYEARGGDPIQFSVTASPAGTYKYELRGIGGAGSEGSIVTGLGDSNTGTYKAPDGLVGRVALGIRVINPDNNQYFDASVKIDVNPKTDLTAGPGVGSTPGLTNDNTPTFDFRAITGQTPTVVAGATFACELDSSPVSCSGPSFTSGVLADGPHTFKVMASKGADFTDPQWATTNFTVDATAPNVIITGGPSTKVQSTSATFTFTNNDPSATVECKLDSGSWGACSSPKAYNSLGQGAHTFYVRATDAASNEGSTSRSWTADTQASVTIVSGPNNGNTIARPAIAFSTDPDIVSTECRVWEGSGSAGPFSACTSPFTTPALVKNITYRFEVKVTDDLGNTDSKTRNWSQTNTAPSPGSPTVIVNAGDTATVDLSSGSTDSDGDSLGSYTVTSAGQAVDGYSTSLSNRITPGTANPNSGSVQVQTANNATGNYTFTFSVSDGRQGGVSTGTATVRVRPDTKDLVDPAQPTSDSTPQWTFSAKSETTDFQCRLLTSADVEVRAWETCANGSYAPSVADGIYKVEVRARFQDLVDQSPLTSGNVEVDTVSPDIDITGPASVTGDSDGLSNVADPAFTFVTTDPDPRVTFECRTDQDAAGTWKACTSGAAYTGMTDGNRTFQVRSKDAAGNKANVDSFTWERDTTDPDFVINSGPDDGDWTNLRRPVWDYTERDLNPITNDKNLLPATTTCKIDSGSVVNDCPNQWTAPSFLNDGEHTLTLEVQDTAGNVGTEEFDFTVATTSPAAYLEDTPDNPSGTSASFAFITDAELGPIGKFQCRTSANGGSFSVWADCASPYSPPGLQVGVNTFQVRAVDSAGNAGSGPFVASYTWNVLATPIAQLTATKTGFRNAAFRFVSSNDPLATFECKVDSGTYSACTSPKTYSGLTLGSHTFYVRAVNEVGNGPAAQHTWTATPAATPNTEITRRPAAITALTSTSFEFVSDDPLATFECQLDGGEWGSCESPKAYEGLANGEHTFSVRATNDVAQTDASPASWTWTVADQGVDPVPGLLAASVEGPRSVKAGREFTLRITLRNGGTEDATDASVCLVSPKAMVLGETSRCKTIDVEAQATVTVNFKVSTRAGMSGRKARFRTLVRYQSAGEGKKEYTGHVTLLK